jgi:hypothetical protein
MRKIFYRLQQFVRANFESGEGPALIFKTFDKNQSMVNGAVSDPQPSKRRISFPTFE